MNDHSEKEKPALSPSIQQWIADEAKRISDYEIRMLCGCGPCLDEMRNAFEQFALAVAARVQQKEAA